jgi:hypothetical protein
LIIEETSTGFKANAFIRCRLCSIASLSYYKGVLISTILTETFAGILVRGTVKNASFYNCISINRSKTALPLIRFTQD